MDDFEFKRLRQYQTGGTRDKMSLSLPLPRSPKGMVQRYCPENECVPRRFQLGDPPNEQSIPEKFSQLARRQPGSKGTTCPYCGSDHDDDEFIAPEDLKAAEEYVKWAAAQDIGDWMEKLAGDFNRSVGQNPLFSVKMEVRRDRETQPYPWREDLLRSLMCDICGREYGVYALGLFCPDCGGRNVHVHFRRETELVAKMVSIAETAEKEGDLEFSYRLLGNAYEDILTALETYFKVIFRFLSRARLSPDQREALDSELNRGNPFQNVVRTRDLFGRIEIEPFSILSAAEMEFLCDHIDKRHIIGHNLGLVDERYLRTGGAGREGENIRIGGRDVLKFADLAYRIIVLGVEETAIEFLPQGRRGPE